MPAPEKRGATALKARAIPIARALKTIAAATGAPFKMDTRPGRFRIQKTVYLLKRLGYGPAKRYEYNLYRMGPYSPDLAQEYYALENPGLAGVEPASDVPASTQKVIVETLSHSQDFVEGLTTLLDLESSRKDAAAALKHARALKAHITDATWKEVQRFLQTQPALTAST